MNLSWRLAFSLSAAKPRRNPYRCVGVGVNGTPSAVGGIEASVFSLFLPPRGGVDGTSLILPRFVQTFAKTMRGRRL